ncbi:hypothetical protein BX070DRAFT_246966 [Coemansia spiralis]|nr:hypothetical protein BX070DRAFT_246966 [Coemansia spiralis]
MDITSTLNMQTEQPLSDVEMPEEDESCPRNCEPENSHIHSIACSGWQNSRLHAEDSIFIHTLTLMDIDPPESTHGEKLLGAPFKPENEPKKKQTEAKARESYRRYTPQQIKRLFDLVIEEGRSAKEAALMTGINVRTAQNYAKTYRDDEQKRLPGIKRKPRKECLGKLNVAHIRLLTHFVNQSPTTQACHSARLFFPAAFLLPKL